MRRHRAFCAAIACFVSSLVPVVAQSQQSRFMGAVADGSGAALPAYFAVMDGTPQFRQPAGGGPVTVADAVMVGGLAALHR